MRFVRYLVKAGAAAPGNPRQPRYGWLHQERVGLIEGDPFGQDGAFQRMEAMLELSQVQLLPPAPGGKIICVGRNYVEHAREHNAEVPELPLLFLKPTSSLLGPDQPIHLPPQSERVEHEGELAVVIGKRARWLPAEQAASVIFGYTIANDVTARDLQRKDGQWTRAKGFDTFCPLGPWIETDFDPTDALLSVQVNGVTRQMSSTREMVFKIPQLLAYASSIMTLEPGDLLLTGTPAGVGPLNAGDVVEVQIEGLGALRNPVAAETPNPAAGMA